MRGLWPLAILSLSASLVPVESEGGIKIPGKGDKPSKEFKAQFERTWGRGATYAVVQVEGIPAAPADTLGVEGIDVKDGAWKRSGSIFNWHPEASAITGVLRRGEVVELMDVRGSVTYKPDRIELLVRSVEPHPGLQGTMSTVSVNFKFFFPADLDNLPLPEVLAYVERYLKPFGTREEAQRAASSLGAAETKAVKLGQTQGEVEGVLGKPQKTVDLGPKVIYVYPDMKVVFSNGKVADVQ